MKIYKDGKIGSKIRLFLSFFLFATGFFIAEAYVSSSTNFRIETDVISFGGGFSSSTNFKLEDSLSEKLFLTVSTSSPTYISVSYPDSVALSGEISSVSGGQSNGSVSVTVTTNNPSGYSLAMDASTNPALQSSQDSFLNYRTVSSDTPDYFWSISPDNSRFGFSIEGSHANSKYIGDGKNCGTGGTNLAGRCWDSVNTSSKTIANSSISNETTGTETKINFRAEAGRQRYQPSGDYSATISLTALAL